MIAISSRASPGGSSALRQRCTRRSLLVTVPSDSHQLADAGKTTSASSPVFVRKMSCTIRWRRPAQQFDRVLLIGLRLRRVLADDVQRVEFAAFHRVRTCR